MEAVCFVGRARFLCSDAEREREFGGEQPWPRARAEGRIIWGRGGFLAAAAAPTFPPPCSQLRAAPGFLGGAFLAGSLDRVRRVPNRRLASTGSLLGSPAMPLVALGACVLEEPAAAFTPFPGFRVAQMLMARDVWV